MVFDIVMETSPFDMTCVWYSPCSVVPVQALRVLPAFPHLKLMAFCIGSPHSTDLATADNMTNFRVQFSRAGGSEEAMAAAPFMLICVCGSIALVN